MAYPRGAAKPAASGRRKGTPNKNTSALRDMILAALHEQPGGGVEYLKRQAVENPNAFMTMLGKVLPMTLAGDADAPLTITTIKRLIVDPVQCGG